MSDDTSMKVGKSVRKGVWQGEREGRKKEREKGGDGEGKRGNRKERVKKGEGEGKRRRRQDTKDKNGRMRTKGEDRKYMGASTSSHNTRIQYQALWWKNTLPKTIIICKSITIIYPTKVLLGN